MNKKFLIFGSIACLVLFITVTFLLFQMQLVAYGSNNSGYPENIVIFSIGKAPLTSQNMSMENYDEWFSKLRQVTIDSDKDLDMYYYPNGPVIGHGYDVYGSMDVQINKDWKVNQTEIMEIYQVIAKNGKKNGIQNISCKFLSMGLLNT